MRVARSRLHRQAKGAELPYEDEKYAYIAVSRQPAAPCAARVLRHPLTRKGHVVLELCAPGGKQTVTVTRSRKEAYRLARDLSWGSPVPPEMLREEEL